MAIVKESTRRFTLPPPTPACDPEAGDWKAHPHLITAMESLAAYEEWVSNFVMPIAFQWIEENYTEVYKRIPRDANHDDIGAVVAAAFSLVETMSAYQKGIQAADEYKRAVADGTWAAKTSSINPVWAKVTGKIREAKAKAFQSEKRVFKDTIT